MTQAYTPGLTVAAQVQHRCRRVLPIAGEVLTAVGRTVSAQDVVAQTFMPGDITPINMANQLSVSASDVPRFMLKKAGERISAGELMARTNGIFGMFKAECTAKVTGTIEAISSITGQVMLRGEPHPVQVCAYLTGKVIELVPNFGVVVQSEVSLIQGIFGVGGEAFGKIRMACDKPDQILTPDRIQPDMRGAIVIGGARVTAEALTKGIETGVAAIVTGGLDDQDLRNFLGYDLGVAVTGSEQIGLTLVITEGFGDIAMADRTFKLLARRAGAEASVNGTTQIRAGVLRPEVVIPWGDASPPGKAGVSKGGGHLAPGVSVRIIRDPYFGIIGTVSRMPSEPQVLGSGSKARVLEVKTASGEIVAVPRANVEFIED